MSREAQTQTQAVWVPGHPGWQGQQRSTAGVTVVVVILALAALGYAVMLVSDPAPAMKLLAAGVVAAVATTGWLFTAHMRLSRVRVVRVRAGEGFVEFGGAAEVVWPLRMFAVAGALVLGGWAWAFASVPSDRMTTLTLLLLPLVGAGLTVIGVRAWFTAPSAHRLRLTPDGVDLRIPRNDLRARWDEVGGAGLDGERVVIRAAGRGPASWATRDLASDPVILADLVTFYARRPAARAEIGSSTIARLRSGEFSSVS